MRSAVIALIGIALACPTASANIIQAQCGTQIGKGFAVEGGIVSAEAAGWYEDRMAGETVIRIDADAGTVDVRFRDSTGIWQTVEDQGGNAVIHAAQDMPPSFMIVVAYPGATVETLTIALTSESSGTLIHTVSRAMSQIVNSRVMIADCTFAIFD